MSRLGKIVTGVHVREAAEATLRKWSPTYIAEVSGEHFGDRCMLPQFQSYASLRDLRSKKPEGQTPACVIVAPGTVGDPSKHSGGKWRVRWGLGVGVFVSARDEESTNDLVELYIAAVRTCLLQQQSLGGFAVATDWDGELYDGDLSIDGSRTYGGGMVNLTVDVDIALDSRAGLIEPLDDPCSVPPELPIIQSVSADLQ